MPDKVIHYAVIDELSSRERPRTVFRRTCTEAGGVRDQVFTKDLEWEPSWMLVSAERGDTQYDFVEISKDEAHRIMDRIRAEVTGASDS